jgi:hypothetical protein
MRGGYSSVLYSCYRGRLFRYRGEGEKNVEPWKRVNRKTFSLSLQRISKNAAHSRNGFKSQETSCPLTGIHDDRMSISW